MGIGIATEKELREWGVMEVLKSPSTEKKVAKLGNGKSGKLRKNFILVEEKTLQKSSTGRF